MNSTRDPMVSNNSTVDLFADFIIEGLEFLRSYSNLLFLFYLSHDNCLPEPFMQVLSYVLKTPFCDTYVNVQYTTVPGIYFTVG